MAVYISCAIQVNLPWLRVGQTLFAPNLFDGLIHWAEL